MVNVVLAFVVTYAIGWTILDVLKDRAAEARREARRAQRRLDALRSGRLWVVDESSERGRA